MRAHKFQLISDLFLNERRSLLYYLSRRVGREDASDLLQEAFVRLVDRASLDDVSNPAAFLRRTASNLATDLEKHRKVERKYVVTGDETPNAAAEQDNPEQSVEARERGAKLRAAIDSLPTKCREVFVMRMHQDLPQDEIARRLGISRKMVDRHLQLAILRCRSFMT